MDAFRKIAEDVAACSVFPEVSAERAECYSALGGACFAASDRAVQDGDEKSAPGDGDGDAGRRGRRGRRVRRREGGRRRREGVGDSLGRVAGLLKEANSSYEARRRLFELSRGRVPPRTRS